MASKRSRKDFEADLQAKQSPYCFAGTPLPPLDPNINDDGAYVPVWKQDARDERGRKRFHGAFTGGYSAGYFNTVGSEEGWTPQTFVSSRNNRHKDASKSEQARREQYMDDEDLADAADSMKLGTQNLYGGFGTTQDDPNRQRTVMDLFRPTGETKGTEILKMIGWRPGHGIGAWVKRSARLGDDESLDQQQHLFPPEDTAEFKPPLKTDYKGLGFESEAKLGQDAAGPVKKNDSEDGDAMFPSLSKKKSSLATKPRKPAFGVGVLNDDDDDEDEDPYNISPSVTYNRVIGGDKKKKKAPSKLSATANPLLSNRPVFRSKKLIESEARLRTGHDGRLPLDGFVLGAPPNCSTIEDLFAQYPHPTIPDGWKSSKTPEIDRKQSEPYMSVADAARASTLDPKARSAILGEARLPDKSVFDFLSPEARERIAAATGRSSLPAARGEALSAPAGLDRNRPLLNTEVPPLLKATALAALGRGVGGWFPYADDEAKRDRYRAFLEYSAGLRTELPPRAPAHTADNQLAELREFAHAADVFKPMSGAMASRFTSASAPPGATVNSADANARDALLTTGGRPADPAEEAARMGMYGPMTRSQFSFAPVRLVCKRFGVPPPPHAVERQLPGQYSSTPIPTNMESSVGGGVADLFAGKEVRTPSGLTMAQKLAERRAADPKLASPQREVKMIEAGGLAKPQLMETAGEDTFEKTLIDGKRAADELFKSVFGDDSDDDE